MSIQIKRIYDAAAHADGTRILVDRIWPRGVAKADAALDDWCKTVAPSTRLRRWFGHDRDRWDAFCERYRIELDEADPKALAALRNAAQDGVLSLLYAARDTECNHAIVLKRYLDKGA